jgi:cytoskeletal protein RodZ
LFGEILKEKREKLGLNLREVAHTLRIQSENLKALENGDLERLPPDVYVKAYIREYAKFLNIDPKPLLDEYATLTMKNEEEAPLPPPLPRKKSALLRISLPASLVAAVIVGFFIYTQTYERKAVVPVTPATPTVPESPGSAQSTSELLPSKPEPQHMLDVTATETTWLRIEPDGGESEEMLLKPGETKKWTSPNGFNLKVGNAGGVRLVLDNKDMGVPGERGRVVKLRLPEESR